MHRPAKITSRNLCRSHSVPDLSTHIDSDKMDSEVKILKSNFQYIATKRDELSFNEGQVIRVVRSVEGGWTEGLLELDGTAFTGWFPTAYCSLLAFDPLTDLELDSLLNISMEDVTKSRLRTIIENNQLDSALVESARSENLEDDSSPIMRLLKLMIADEKDFVESISKFKFHFVVPLSSYTWFSVQDHEALFGSIDSLLSFHSSLLSCLEDSFSLAGTTLKQVFTTKVLFINHRAANSSLFIFFTASKLQLRLKLLQNIPNRLKCSNFSVNLTSPSNKNSFLH